MYLDMQWHIGIIEQNVCGCFENRFGLLKMHTCEHTHKWSNVWLKRYSQLTKCDDVAVAVVVFVGVTNDTMILVMVMSIWIWLIESWKSPRVHFQFIHAFFFAISFHRSLSFSFSRSLSISVFSHFHSCILLHPFHHIITTLLLLLCSSRIKFVKFRGRFSFFHGA